MNSSTFTATGIMSNAPDNGYMYTHTTLPIALSICFDVRDRDDVPHPYRSSSDILFLRILILYILESDGQIKGSLISEC
jgi:hypothetical protein